MSNAAAAENALVDEIGGFTHDPLGFVEFAYDWGHGELEGEAVREWQADILGTIGKRLQNPKTRHMPIQIAVASGHGIGKSALIGMIVQWGMSTCEDTKVVTTANTRAQLTTKTWPEVGTWHRRAINAHWFTHQATSLHSTDPKREKTWRADAVTWSVNNTEAFAGLHNKGKRIVVIFDEASSIDDKVWEVTKGALTDKDTEIIWIAFGNPTRNTGAFKNCFTGDEKHRWITRQIDSRDVEGTNLELFKEWIADKGINSDFVKVRVRGLFPNASLKQFITTADADGGFDRPLRETQYNWAPKTISVEPAWEGDDELVIGMRQGLRFDILRIMEKNDNDVTVASIVAGLEDEHQADAVFIDAGYGTGIVSVGRTLKRNWQLVWFGGQPSDPGCLNKRSEMWRDMRDWLKEGGSYPKDPLMQQELIAPETIGRLDGKIQLESKKDMKHRGVPSPNRADCLAITFAYPVSHKLGIKSQGSSKTQVDYDPFAELQ